MKIKIGTKLLLARPGLDDEFSGSGSIDTLEIAQDIFDHALVNYQALGEKNGH